MLLAVLPPAISQSEGLKFYYYTFMFLVLPLQDGPIKIFYHLQVVFRKFVNLSVPLSPHL